MLHLNIYIYNMLLRTSFMVTEILIEKKEDGTYKVDISNKRYEAHSSKSGITKTESISSFEYQSLDSILDECLLPRLKVGGPYSIPSNKMPSNEHHYVLSKIEDSGLLNDW